MRNTTKRKSILLRSTSLLMMAALLGSCSLLQGQTQEKERPDTGRLISFHYTYGNYRYRPFEYIITRETDENGSERISFQAEGFSDDLFSLKEEIEESVLDEIVRILEEENIFAWDGFKKYNQEIRDGFSFSLRVKFEQLSIEASGYMERPVNFKEGHKRLSEYLLELAQGFRTEEDAHEKNL